MKLSFVIPLKNEFDSLREIVRQISNSVNALPSNYVFEIILVDDGSNDDSWASIQEMSESSSESVKGIRLRRNFGKSMAIQAGFRAASGDVVFTMDADLQDDPKETRRFLEKLDKGFDLVSGWRIKRHDPFSKKVSSKLFNWVTARVSGVKLHDFNCGFKCYKREVIEQLSIYGELHRYIPILASDIGYKIGEIEVEHHPRIHGVSKYGWKRYIRGFVDLATVMATTRWMNKPGHLFGGIGVLLGLVGGAALSYLTVLWLLGLRPIGNRPLLLFGILLCISSLQMISLGVIAEFFVKSSNYYQVDMLIAEKSGFLQSVRPEKLETCSNKEISDES